MKRVLLTGMSGTGKSVVISELAARGYKAIDTDYDGWSELTDVPANSGHSGVAGEQDWLWREDRIARLLSTEDADALFISGCPPNQVKFYGHFDHIVLLTAPKPVLTERLVTRTNNPYGKHPDELARVIALNRPWSRCSDASRIWRSTRASRSSRSSTGSSASCCGSSRARATDLRQQVRSGGPHVPAPKLT